MIDAKLIVDDKYLYVYRFETNTRINVARLKLVLTDAYATKPRTLKTRINKWIKDCSSKDFIMSELKELELI